MPKLDLAAIPRDDACGYPSPFDRPCRGGDSQRLGRAGGLTSIGVNLTRLPPGVWSGQRHWHSHEDELVYLVDGPCDIELAAGDSARLAVTVGTRTRADLSLEAHLISPWGTWEWIGPAAQGAVLPAGGTVELGFDVNPQIGRASC